MLYLSAKEFNHQLQVVKLRAKEVCISVLCIPDHHYYPLKFQGGFC
jgi:hypothetical protein